MAPNSKPITTSNRGRGSSCAAAMHHNSAVINSKSSDAFCRMPSKKIAGGYRASSNPANRPARSLKKRAPAWARKTQDAAPTDGLQQPHGPHAVPADTVNDRQQVRVKRRLIEDFLPDPLAAGDALCPTVVLSAVADQRPKTAANRASPESAPAHRQRQRRTGSPPAMTRSAGAGLESRGRWQPLAIALACWSGQCSSQLERRRTRIDKTRTARPS